MESVNKGLPRVDGVEKVTGKAQYGADLYADQMLYAKVLRAKLPSARILHIDTEKAKSLPGVVAVVTAEDIPGDGLFGIISANLPLLVDKRIRSIGDGLVLVAAETEKIAEEALERVSLQVSELPGVYSVWDAIKPSAPRVHEEVAGNVDCHHVIRKGDVEEGFRSADVVFEREYQTQQIEHAYMEPEAVLALPSLDEGVTVKGSIQNPFSTRRVVAQALDLPLNKVRIIQSCMGGSFGGKDDVMSILSARAALLAIKTKRPIKLVNTREESMQESYKRHPYFLRYKVGVKKDGTLTAMEYTIHADGGAYASMTAFVTWRTVVQATGPYHIPHVKGDVYGIYTNNPYAGAMRGFGSPQPIFAQESLMDEIAHSLGMTPLEIRKRNGFTQNSVTATGQVLDTHRVSLMEVMEKACKEAEYEEKYKEYQEEQTGRMRRGIGLAISYRGCSLGAEGVDATGAFVSVQTDGTVYIHSGLTENGQGLKTIFSQIAAEEFGISLERIAFVDTDTALIPDGGPTVASRSTLMGGNAVRIAAVKVRNTLVSVAARLLNTSSEEISWGRNRFFKTGKEEEGLSFKEVVQEAHFQGELLAGIGWFKAPKVDWDEEHGQGRAYFTYVYGCHVAEVEVDTLTGKVKVEKVVAAHDVGSAINPETVAGQIYGGVAMGLGYALLEEFEVEKGRIKTLNFEDYLVPGAKDVPHVIPIIVENPDGFGPYGAKSIGEPSMEITAPAIANAVFQATKKRIRELPLNLERVALGYALVKGEKK